MAFIDYGFIAIKNNKIITDLDKLPVEPYKYLLEDKEENYYKLPEDIEKFKKSLTGYDFIKFKKYMNKNLTLYHITLKENSTGEFLNILYGYDVNKYYIRNYFVAKRCKAFLNRYADYEWKLKRSKTTVIKMKYYKLKKKNNS